LDSPVIVRHGNWWVSPSPVSSPIKGEDYKRDEVSRSPCLPLTLSIKWRGKYQPHLNPLPSRARRLLRDFVPRNDKAVGGEKIALSLALLAMTRGSRERSIRERELPSRERRSVRDFVPRNDEG